MLLGKVLKARYQHLYQLTQTQKKKWTPRKAPDASTSRMSLHRRFLSSASDIMFAVGYKLFVVLGGHRKSAHWCFALH